MRIIGDVTLFKTPLDSEYKNVYDNYPNDSYATYKVFLRSSFSYITISNQNVKSRKDIDLTFELEIAGYTSLALHDYNYIEFQAESRSPLFAFITKVESLNDGAQTKSCKLTCKFDAWTNNYTAIKNSFNSVEENRCSYDTNINKHFPTKLFNVKTAENVKISNCIKFATDVEGQENNYVALWQRIVYTNKCRLSVLSPNEPTVYVDIADGVNNNEGGIVFYRLAGIAQYKDSDNYNISDIRFLRLGLRLIAKVIPHSQSGEALPPAVVTLFTRSFSGKEITVCAGMESHILSNSLTFNVPFKYKVTIKKSIPTLQEPDLAEVDIYDTDYWFNYGNLLSTSPNEGSPTTITRGIVDDYFINLNNRPYAKMEIDNEITFEKITYNVNKRYSTSESFSSIEEIANEYPLKYYSLKSGNFDVNIAPPKNSTKAKVILNIDNKITPDIKIEVENGESLSYLPITNETTLYNYTLELNEYLRDNQNQISTNISLAMANMVKSLADFTATGYPESSGFQGALSTVSKEYSKQADLANIPARGVLPSRNSAVVPYVLDCLFVLLHISSLTEEICKDYHFNGYECSLISSITTTRRDVFDIDKGKLQLNAFISNECKNEIVNAVERGITRWHILGKSGQSTSERQTVLSSMNKNVVNYSNSLIPY